MNNDQVKNLVDSAVDEYGQVNLMLNNVGLIPLAPLEKLRVDEWDQMIDVNTKGVMEGIPAALTHVKEKKSGHIINVSSLAGHVVEPESVVYAATKHSVRTILEELRQEVKP